MNWKGTSMLLVGRSVTVIGLCYFIGEGAFSILIFFLETFSSTRLGCQYCISQTPWEVDGYCFCHCFYVLHGYWTYQIFLSHHKLVNSLKWDLRWEGWRPSSVLSHHLLVSLWRGSQDQCECQCRMVAVRNEWNRTPWRCQLGLGDAE